MFVLGAQTQVCALICENLCHLWLKIITAHRRRRGAKLVQNKKISFSPRFHLTSPRKSKHPHFLHETRIPRQPTFPFVHQSGDQTHLLVWGRAGRAKRGDRKPVRNLFQHPQSDVDPQHHY